MRYLTALFLLCAFHTQLRSQLVEISLEPYVIHDGSISELDGMTTYHVFAVCTNPSDEVSSVYGDATAPLTLTSTNGFYQNALGNNTGWNINPAFFGAFPAIEYDSWITLGVLNQDEVNGQPNTVGMDDAFVEFAMGGDLIVNSNNGGSWFTLYGDAQAQAGDDLKVLLAQLTVSNDAVITGNFNVQIFVDGLQSNNEQFEGVTLNQIAIEGCTFEIACNYDPNALIDDGSCVFICEGCMDSSACNFDPSASLEDGSCDYASCIGCTDSSACNFSLFYTIDDGSCIFPSYGYDCDDECLSDEDGDGVCDLLEVPGCLDPNACNFDDTATEWDDSCEYLTCAGCTYELACNYDPGATISNNATCEFGTCGGCLDPSACNFNPTVGFDDGSCSFPESELYDCAGQCINDADGDGICEEEILGCTDMNADNFDSTATNDDGSCTYNDTYTLTVEEYAVDIVPGQITYRMFIDMANSDDFLSSVYGGDTAPLSITTSNGSFWNSAFGGTTASAINPVFLAYFPELAADSWVTIGIDQHETGDEVGVSTLEDPLQPFLECFAFGSALDGQDVLIDSSVGGAWYVLNGTPNGLPDENMRVLFLQMTTAGEICGTINAQVYENGMGSASLYFTYDFCGTGTFGPSVGCTDEFACNYDENATSDDGSCEYTTCTGCTNVNACNYEPEALIEDGSCDYTSCVGCTDLEACNYDPLFTIDNGSCEYISCNQGCIDEFACNFDSGAIYDDGSCEYDSCSGCTDVAACNYDINALYENGLCDYDCYDCTDPVACNYNVEATEDDGSCIYCGEMCSGTSGYNLVVEVYAEDIISGHKTYRMYQTVLDPQDFLSSVYGNEDVPFAFQTTEGFYNSQFGGTVASSINPAFLAFFPELVADSWVTIGIESQNVGDEVAISTVESSDQPWVAAFSFGESISGQDIFMNDPTGGAWYVINNTPNGVPDENGRVLIMQVTTSGDLSGTINTQVFGGGSGSNSIYNTYVFSGAGEFGENGTVNSCGCTDIEANNYDEAAEYDDGSCEYPVFGCTDSTACNFDVYATTDDGSCEFPAFGYNCFGECIADTDEDGVCDANEIPGCMDGEACNFNADATDDDGSCSYPQSNLYDCDGLCINDLDGDGICDEDEVIGCSYPNACNYDATATDDDGECVFPEAGFDCDGNCLFDYDGDGLCDQDEVVGCSDQSACNYNAETTEEGFCDYDSCIVEGCTDENACNYNPNASVDDSSCLEVDECGVCGGNGILEGACDCDGNFPEVHYGCDGECENDIDGDGVCDELEVTGCTDEEACNFNVDATDESGGCDYCTCLPSSNDLPYTITVEVYAEGVIEGMTTYRFYIDLLNDDDFLSSIYGNEGDQFYLTTETGFYNDDFGSSVASGINPAFFSFFPTLEADSWITIGIDSQNVGDEAAISTVESSLQPFVGAFSEGSDMDGQDIFINDFAGGAWYVTNGTPNGLPDENGRVLILQLTTADSFDAQINAQIFENGIGSSDLRKTFHVDGIGTYFDDEYIICGCDDPLACNYDDSATHNDGSCAFDCFGCTDSSACNYNATATEDDGSCELPDVGYDCQGECISDIDEDGVCDANEVPGCTDGQACNYNSEATDEDGSCTYPISSNYDCTGNCFNDADGDGICDEDEVHGCTYLEACNYYEEATNDDGSCEFPQDGFNCDGSCLFDEDGDGVCDEDEIVGCQDTSACNFSALATDPGYCFYPDLNYDCQGNCINDTDGDGICDENETSGCTDHTACNFDTASTDDDGSCLFPAPGYDCDGVGTINGCMDESACTFNPAATIETADDLCLYPVPNYDCQGNCINDTDDDGICDENETSGCTDHTACNFDAAATDDDGSCLYPAPGYDCDGVGTINGCMDESACNFNPTATIETANDVCLYPVLNYDCQGNCVNDTDGDGICDEDESSGCTDHTACNFDTAATDDDGSCLYPAPGYDCDGVGTVNGCMDESACNFNPTATIETSNDVCLYPVPNYDCSGNCINDADSDGICDELEDLLEDEIQTAIANATEELVAALANGEYCGEGTMWVEEWGYCAAIPTCFGDHNNDGNRGTEDLLLFLAVYGTDCPAEFGCTNTNAFNYDPFAVYDDGSCVLPVLPCENEEAIEYLGEEYSLIQTDSACWFASNLRASEFSNGDPIEEITGPFDWYLAGTGMSPAYSEVDADLHPNYGYFYNGYSVIDDRGLCPAEWHVATEGDWQEMELYLGMDDSEVALFGPRGNDEGESLKSTSLDSPPWNGSNSIGFSALPTGLIWNYGSISEVGSSSSSWTSTLSGTDLYWRKLTSESSQIDRSLQAPSFGATVRCVKD